MQSHRFVIPVVSAPVRLNDLRVSQGALVLVLTTQPTTINLKTWVESQTIRPKALYVFIGPEGGWTAAEEVFVATNGWNLVSFGESVMRAETACLGVLSALRYAYHTVS